MVIGYVSENKDDIIPMDQKVGYDSRSGLSFVNKVELEKLGKDLQLDNKYDDFNKYYAEFQRNLDKSGEREKN